MTDPRLPPSRFAAGHTVGGQSVPSRPTPFHPPPQSHYVPPVPSQSAAAPEPTNRIAILSFALALALGPLAVFVAAPTAYAAQRQCRRTGERGAGLAKAASFISVAYLALAAVVAILRVLLGN